MGFSASVIVALSNLPMGWALYELLKVVNARAALLALLFVCVAATLEAANLVNYITPLFVFSLPEYRHAFTPVELQALARLPIRLFDYLFNVDLAFFSGFCVLTGALIFRSRFLPAVLGLMMMLAGAAYAINSFKLFLALPIPYIPWVTLVAESCLALWLLVVGVDEAKWRERAEAPAS
jgi:hypothetical protein